MDVSDIFGLGASALTGGITGLIGVFGKGLFAWLGAKVEMQKMKMQQDHEARLLDLQLQARRAEWEHESDIAAEETRRASYSYADISGQPLWKWAASVVTLVRPLLTLMLLGATFAIAYTLFWKGAAIPYINTAVTMQEVVATILYLTTTACTWWFGDRPPQKR